MCYHKVFSLLVCIAAPEKNKHNAGKASKRAVDTGADTVAAKRGVLLLVIVCLPVSQCPGDIG